MMGYLYWCRGNRSDYISRLADMIFAQTDISIAAKAIEEGRALALLVCFQHSFSSEPMNCFIPKASPSLITSFLNFSAHFVNIMILIEFSGQQAGHAASFVAG